MVLHDDVLPFHGTRDLPVTAILTDNPRELCGTERLPFGLWLERNGTGHRRTKVRRPQTNGFVERFNATVLDAFFPSTMRKADCDAFEALQADRDASLVHHDTE